MRRISRGVICMERESAELRALDEEITVLIVDDHRSFSDLLSSALSSVRGITCLGTAASAAEGILLANELKPTGVLMDIQMPGLDGLTATRRVREASPRTAVAVITAHQDGEWISRAAQAGASAFIPKDGSLRELIDVLKLTKPGSMTVAPSVLGPSPAEAAPSATVVPELTTREREVLGYIGQGLQAKSIARVLGISIHTCRGYIKSVYAKLHVSSRIEAVNTARELNLIGEPNDR